MTKIAKSVGKIALIYVEITMRESREKCGAIKKCVKHVIAIAQ